MERTARDRPSLLSLEFVGLRMTLGRLMARRCVVGQQAGNEPSGGGGGRRGVSADH